MASCRLAARTLALACALLSATTFAADLPASAWKQDLDFLARELPRRHKNLFFRLSRNQFETQVRQIAAALPSMTGLEVRVALRRLVASAANAHTAIAAFRGSAAYPIHYRVFPDGIYVTAAKPEYARALGCRLIAVGEMPVEEVQSRLLTMIAMETDLMPWLELPVLLRTADALRGARILPGADQGQFWFDNNGRKFDLTLQTVAPDERITWENWAERVSGETPLYLSNTNLAYWFRYLKEPRALYIRYNSCQNMKSPSFREFTAQIVEAAERNPVDKLVLDLRHNGGGLSMVIEPLVSALKRRPALTRRDHVFVITSPDTFSSAFLNAWRFKTEFQALIAGEASAQRPNSYGDVREFQLPNSGLRVRYSTQYYRTMPGDPPRLEPDIPVPLTADDFFSGRDPALERILKSR